MNIPDNETVREYNISFEDRADYLYVYVTGEHDNYEISSRYWMEVAEQCRIRNVKKVLIEEDIPETSSMADVYKLAAALPEMGFLGVRVAFLDCFVEQHDLNEFGELVAINRGLYGKVFNKFDEAESWLLSD